MADLHRVSRADRPGARRAAQGQVGTGRHADLPPLVRARRLRLRRDADQRTNRLACKTLIKDVNPEKPSHRRADQGPAGAQGPHRRHGAVLRGVPLGHAVPRHDRQRADPRADPVAGGPRPLRRHDQVHPVRGLHDVLPGVLERRPVLRPAGDRRRAPVHLRQPRRGRRRSGWRSSTTSEGVWRCRTTFNCTEACPRGIEVTKAIQEVKRALIFRRV